METTDVAALWDSPVYNAGFIVVKPTDASKQLYQTIRSMTSQSTDIDDQVALNKAIDALQRRNSGLRVTVLNKQRFQNGFEYFEGPRRWFPLKSDDKCTEKKRTNCPVVVHNNWIVGKEAKIYRFREHLLWLFDDDDQYYTSNTRPYMTYTNKADSNQKLCNRTRLESEISALKSAMTIGYLLNRTVILPKFRIGRKALENPLNSLVHIKTFDGEFSGKYRENSFLRHPKVPHHIKTELYEQRVVMGKTDNLTVSRFDILRQFGGVKASVLVIGSLRDVNVALRNTSEDAAFGNKLDRALRRSDYRQSRRW